MRLCHNERECVSRPCLLRSAFYLCAISSDRCSLTLLSFQHPLGQLLYECALAQHRAYGTGVTTLICLSAYWVREILQMVEEVVPHIPFQTILSAGPFLYPCRLLHVVGLRLTNQTAIHFSLPGHSTSCHICCVWGSAGGLCARDVHCCHPTSSAAALLL